jgi:hypothetical protein
MIFVTAFLFGAMLVIYFLANYLDRILAFLGASAGFVLIFLIPLSVNVIYYRLKHPLSLKYGAEYMEYPEVEGNNSLVTIKTEKTEKNEKNENNDITNPPGLSKKPYNECKNYTFYVTQVVLIVFGLFVLFVQFFPINFFGVEIEK